MSQAMYSVVHVDVRICVVAVVVSNHVFVIQRGRLVRGTQSIAFRPFRHEMGKIGETAVAAGSTIVGNRLISIAMGREYRYRRPAGVTGDGYSRWTAILLAVTLVIGS
jgi:hypothetical protein